MSEEKLYALILKCEDLTELRMVLESARFQSFESVIKGIVNVAIHLMG